MAMFASLEVLYGCGLHCLLPSKCDMGVNCIECLLPSKCDMGVDCIDLVNECFCEGDTRIIISRTLNNYITR